MKLKHRVRQIVPKYSPEQAEKSKKLSRKLVNHLYSSDPVIVMDDEKYFTYYSNKMPGNTGFYTDNIENCPDEVKYIGKEKIPPKYWFGSRFLNVESRKL